MLIFINTDIVVFVLDSMLVHNLSGQIVAGVKMLLFLELIIILLCMLIIKKDTLILGEDPIQVSDNTTIIAEAKYPINFTRPRGRFVLRLHYD